MQKTLTFLEHNVQWFALVLGGIFVVYCAYAYVYIPPAVVKVPGVAQPLVPGDVSEATNKVVREEQRKMKENDNFPPIPVTEVVTAWRNQMGNPVGQNLVADNFGSEPGNDKLVQTGPGVIANVQVATLPELPKAQPQLPQSGLSVVALPTPTGGTASAAQPVAAPLDQLWVTVPFIIPAKDIKDAFEKPLKGNKLDPQLYSTDVLQVDLQRQRATGVDANGQPTFPNGEEGVETVPPATIVKNDLQPMPDVAAADAVKNNFVDWAQRNVTLVTQPKFYEVKAGDAWQAPQPPAAAAANPAAPVPPGRAPVQPLPVPFNPHGAPAAVGSNGGHIDPLTIADDILVWSHDETVKPGQTYRYRVVYHMKNPVLNEKGFGDPKILPVLDVKRPPSDWSRAVKVKEKTEFFLTVVQPKGTVKMAVFHWENGKWGERTETLSPGDQVGDTDWMVVDVHGGGGGRDRFVLLTDDSGDVKRHLPTEGGSDRFKALEQEVKNPVGGPAAATGNRPNAPKAGAPSNDSSHGKPLARPDLSQPGK